MFKLSEKHERKNYQVGKHGWQQGLHISKVLFFFLSNSMQYFKLSRFLFWSKGHFLPVSARKFHFYLLISSCYLQCCRHTNKASTLLLPQTSFSEHWLPLEIWHFCDYEAYTSTSSKLSICQIYPHLKGFLALEFG